LHEQAQALSRRLFPQLTTGVNVNRVHDTYGHGSRYRLTPLKLRYAHGVIFHRNQYIPPER